MEKTAGEGCCGEPASLQQLCAWFTSLGFSCDQESEAAKSCCGQTKSVVDECRLPWSVVM